MNLYNGGFQKASVGFVYSILESISECQQWKVKLVGILADSGELYTLKEVLRLNQVSRFNFINGDWCFFRTHMKSVNNKYGNASQQPSELDNFEKPSNEGECIFHIVKIQRR